MSVTNLGLNLSQIIIPTPFPVGPVNVYTIEDPGGGLSLIDTGPRTDPAMAALEQGIADLGYRLTDITRIIITHGHVDHCGLAADIAQISGAKVFAHPYTASSLEEQWSERDRRREYYRERLVEAGVPIEIQVQLAHMLGGLRQYGSDVSIATTLDEGDEVDIGGSTWQVHHMPGHASGLICLLQPDLGLFLSSDHLLRDISSNPFFEPPIPGQTQRRRALVDYVVSLDRTSALEFSVAWPGHGEPVYDHRTLIQNRLAHHRQRAGSILGALANGPNTVYNLSLVIFPDLNPMDRFLSISEVLAHLEWLEDRGAVEAQYEEGRMLWRVAD
jgi:glyoxylase-like metal-dependent hydrolase (beta-lactamase superfamily II)